MIPLFRKSERKKTLGKPLLRSGMEISGAETQTSLRMIALSSHGKMTDTIGILDTVQEESKRQPRIKADRSSAPEQDLSMRLMCAVRVATEMDEVGYPAELQ